ncbi:MotA/TolQ/ExbB proton channel family protein [Candidatus Babeliales bacterium]|nr:MotA/TolQ/ExbB proton channel family protein [Candidatus Babeliales bacterium]
MLNTIKEGSTWRLFAQIDWVTRLVLLALFLISICCVAIIIGKSIELAAKRKNLKDLWKRVFAVRSVQDLVMIAGRVRTTLGGTLLAHILNGAGYHIKTTPVDERPEKLSVGELEHLAMTSEQLVEQNVSETEQFLPILGVTAAAAPLVGLFGTIWGLIHSLVSMGQEQSADLSVVAPGIAEALFTTLAGLAVAIPALVFFHYLSNQLRKIEWKLFALSDRVLAVVRRSSGE